MSGKVSGLIWDLDLPQNEKYVLLCYADHADHEGNKIYPSVGLISWKTGYSKRSIQRITRKLENRGLLVKHSKGKGGRGKITKYSIPIKGDKFASFNRDKRVTPVTEKGDIAMSPETSLNTTEENEGKEQPSRDNSSAPPPDKKKKSKGRDPRLDHHAIQTFRETMRFHAQIAWRDDIIETVGDQEDEWRAHLKDWIGRGYNPRNLKDILRTFREGGISRKPPPPDAPPAESSAALARRREAARAEMKKRGLID